MNKESHILVTGGTGLLGAAIINHLWSKGYTNVSALLRNPSKLGNITDENQIRIIKGDILNLGSLEDAMHNVDAVIHAAGFVSYNPKHTDKIYQINEEGTANIVNTALLNGIKKHVYISSIAAIGRSEKDTVLSEKNQWINNKFNPVYAKSKYLGEQQAWRGMYEGLPCTVINPSIILGQGDWSKSSLKLIDNLVKGSPFYPLGSTGFVDVNDVAHLTVEALKDQYNGERYIASGHNLSYKSFFEKVTQLAGAKTPTIPLTPAWTGIGWRLEWIKNKLTGQDPLLTKETAKSSSLQIEYDNSKSREAFNFEYTPLDQTLDWVIKAYKKTKLI